MGKPAKVIVFVFVCFVIVGVLSAIKNSGGGAVMWLGALVIPIIYKNMFGKNNNDKDITLKK